MLIGLRLNQFQYIIDKFIVFQIQQAFSRTRADCDFLSESSRSFDGLSPSAALHLLGWGLKMVLYSSEPSEEHGRDESIPQVF